MRIRERIAKWLSKGMQRKVNIENFEEKLSELTEIVYEMQDELGEIKDRIDDIEYTVNNTLPEEIEDIDDRVDTNENKIYELEDRIDMIKVELRKLMRGE